MRTKRFSKIQMSTEVSPTEWLDIFLNDEMVEINGKGEVRKKMGPITNPDNDADLQKIDFVPNLGTYYLPEPKEDFINPKDKLGVVKPNLDLVSPSGMIYEALAMQYGAITKGYGPFNWRQKKVKGSIYVAAAIRHIFQYLDGQDVDEESGQPTLGHAKACLGILIDAIESGNLVDDRPIKGPVSQVIAKFTRKK